MDRRQFLRAGMLGVGAALVPGRLAAALGAPPRRGEGPYGPLRPPDHNRVMLPEGFASRVVARAGEAVGGTGHVWHTFPDGGATFPDGGGGWIYVSNSEVPFRGGVGALRFRADGSVADAYPILKGTVMNCAGGPTPWGTWLSCEEWDGGRVWECNPHAPSSGVVRPAMGTFQHEAAAVDAAGHRVYLTEDQPDGCFYRFTPEAWPDLSGGLLEVAVADNLDAAVEGGRALLQWVEVPDPSPLPVPLRLGVSAPTRRQVPGAAVFNGGEGIWFDGTHVHFATKGDHRVWSYRVGTGELEILYDAARLDASPLKGVDNLTVAPAGDVYVAEDGGNMEVVLISIEGEVAPFVRVVGDRGSEVAGPAFSPDGSRLYFSSQRGGPRGRGVTYEVAGPFRRPAHDHPGGLTALGGLLP